MRLPKLKYKENTKKHEQINFSGINRRMWTSDGSIYDLKDISADDYPVLSTINNRYKDETIYENPWYYGMADKPFVIAGNELGKSYTLWTSGAATLYGGQIYAYGGELYTCRTTFSEPSNLKSTPPVYAVEYWNPYTKTSFRYDGVYKTNVSCVEGEIFIYNNSFYRCLKTHTASGNINDGNWEPYRYASLYYDGKKVEGLELVPGKKECIYLNDHIMIFPDKMYYNVHNGKFGHLENRFELHSNKIGKITYNNIYHSELGGRMERYLGWYVGNSSKVLKTGNGTWDILFMGYVNTQDDLIPDKSYWDSYDLRNYFRADDVIKITQTYHSTHTSSIVDGYYIVKEVGDNYLKFDTKVLSGTTTNNESISIYNHSNCYYVGEILIEKTIPDMDYLCNIDNRIWGCKDDTVYSSGLGNPFSWQSYTGIETDAVYIEAGTIEKFTGCCAYNGYPYFFKENEMYRVYGSTPAGYSLQRVADIGIKKGSSHSVCSVNSILMFLSPKGVYAYTGGVPAEVSGVLNDFIYDCIASTDGLKYYGVMTVGNEKRLYVYDVKSGMWSSEHFEGEVLGFVFYDNELRCMNSNGEIFTVSRPTGKYGIEVKEIKDKAVIEFNDFYGGSIGTKDIGRIILRTSVAPEYNALYVYVQYDSDGIWHRVGKIYNQNTLKRVCEFGFFPRRCDHFRIKLECQGKFTLYSMAREITNNG